MTAAGEGSVRKGGSGKKKAAAGGIGAIVLALIVLGVQHFAGIDLTGQTSEQEASPSPRATAEQAKPASSTQATQAAPRNPTTPRSDPTDDAVAQRGAEAIQRAFRNEQSDLIVESAGRVSRVLPDDNEGSRHQRFIVELSTGQTVLIAHNIDLAERVPLREGDFVRFKGEYEWSERGGVLHWTHHDPKGWRDDGWIEHEGKLYG